LESFGLRGIYIWPRAGRPACRINHQGGGVSVSLVGCAFFAFRQSRLAGKKFTVSLAQAIVVNLAVAVFTFFSLEATNDRILGGM
jgi:hypothetical protein